MSLRALFSAAVLFLSTLSQIQAQEPTTDASAEIKTPYDVGPSGSFTYRVPFQIPAFRGMEPNLGLGYNSSNTSRGSMDDILGIGWKLTGFSRIERKNQGRGTPTYTAKDDIFLLDGQVLMACNDTAATNKWAAEYPARFKTDNPSSSCRAGGNFSTIRESDRKILRNASQNTWTIYSQDGTQYIYRSAGSVSGTSTPAGSDADKVLNNTWLLTEIRDTQATPNVVAFSYQFDDANHGWAPRPQKVEYGGYSVHFGYETLSNPLSQWANGTGTIGVQRHRLRSVHTKYGSNQIAAYALDYAASTETKSSLLTRVTQYGNDYTLNAATISGGSALPNPHIFDYSPDQLSFETRTYPGMAIRQSNFIGDFNQDGRDEILQPAKVWRGSDAGGTSCIRGSTPKGAYEFTDARQKGSFLIPTEISSALNAPDQWGRGDRIVGMAQELKADGSSMFQSAVVVDTNARDRGFKVVDFNAHVGSSAVRHSIRRTATTSKYNFTAPGNYDADPETEILYSGWYYDLSSGSAVYTGGAGKGRKDWWTLDIDGDGILEFRGRDRSNDPGFPPATNSPAHPETTTARSNLSNMIPVARDDNVFSQFGDVTGDGIVDLVFFLETPTSHLQVWVFRGNGDWYSAPEKWVDTSELPRSYAYDYKNGQPEGWLKIADLNNDGIQDILFGSHKGPQSAGSCGLSGSVYDARGAVVFLSTGSDFVKPSLASGTPPSNAVSSGDFDGDGKTDLLLSAASGGIAYGNAEVPNLLKSVTDPLGGTTFVSYKSSNQAGGQKHPGDRQVVDEIRRENGLGDTRTTRYSFFDERYDYRLRQSLGYKLVTAYLPKLGNETSEPKLITEYANTDFGSSGTPISKTLMVGNTTWSRESYEHATVVTGNGPYQARKTRHTSATRHGSKLLETSKTYSYSPYGVVTRVTDFGRTENGGQNVAPADDVTTGRDYAPNLAAYIVNKPFHTFRQKGSSGALNRTLALEFQWYDYDGNSHYSAPTRGNVTDFREWTGTPNSWTQRPTAKYTHDTHGNVLTETDALGNVTTHTYGGPSATRQFRESTTNAKNHTTLFGWNIPCGAVSQETDPNNQVTTHEYDTFCRHYVTTFPNGNFDQTLYEYLGQPDKQFIRKASRSGGTTDANRYSYSYDYFDGFGQTHRTRRSGDVNSNSGWIATLFEYDARGNVISESIPLPWSTTIADATNTQKTRTTYDTLGRPLDITQPNGSKQTNEYFWWQMSHEPGVPAMDRAIVRTKDARCYDNDASTVCSRTHNHFDARGRLIRRYIEDANQSDVTIGGEYAPAGPTWRATLYYYDLNDNLTRVVDPNQNAFNYTYDVFGNRLTADDPSLGRWDMSYDALNRLIEQTDAKDQRITFLYDALGRVTRKDVYNELGQRENRIIYTYDTYKAGRANVGQLTRAAQSGHSVVYEYDLSGGIAKESHSIDGRAYTMETTYRYGQVLNRRLPSRPGSSYRTWTGERSYDAAGRLTGIEGQINQIQYNIWDQPTQTTYASGVKDQRSYSSKMGWLNTIDIKSSSGATLSSTYYWRHSDGRIRQAEVSERSNYESFTYDYAGRLLTLDNSAPQYAYLDQTFTYDWSGRIRTNSHVGTYDYSSAEPAHAPYRIRNGSTTTTLTYDANGNMTQGFDGKVMSYDAENRPLSVSKANKTTQYVYGADGTRLKKIENAGSAAETTTLYIGDVEIRDWGTGTGETVISYPAPGVRLVNGVAENIFSDQLGSTRLVTDVNGAATKRAVYKPFGEATDWTYGATATLETKGFIGERFDADAGLQYLNARYYDPKLAIFIQPDWFEVTNPRVGTNRYTYSHNDPVNLNDPNGNIIPALVWGGIVAYKAVSAAIAVADTIDTVEAMANGELTALQAAKSIGTDIAIGVTVGGVGKAAKQVSRGRRSNTSQNTNQSDGCLSSFHPDTLVVGQDGMLAIDQIRVGDYVLAANEATGALSYQRVTATHQSDYAATYVVSVASDDGGEDLLIRASLNHPFFVVYAPGEPRLTTVSAEGLDYQGEIEGGAWVDTRFLREGMHLREADGTLQRITGVEIIEGPLTAYNLTVETDHTYFVGDADDAVWVHNCKGKKRGPKTDPNAPHNKTIREETQKILDDNPGASLESGGGVLREELIKIDGGHKTGRRPDARIRMPDGSTKLLQVGKTNKNGEPIKREREAIEDLEGQGFDDIDFKDYEDP